MGVRAPQMPNFRNPNGAEREETDEEHRLWLVTLALHATHLRKTEVSPRPEMAGPSHTDGVEVEMKNIDYG